MITIGLNYSQNHESSACIVRDGQLLFAVAEERLSRRKHDGRFPLHSIQACLDFAKIRPSQVEQICVGWQSPYVNYAHELKFYMSGRWPLTYANFVNSTKYFAEMWYQKGGANPVRKNFGDLKAPFRFVDHHLAHALSAYCYSGFDDAAVVVMDGRGVWEATSIWKGSNGKLSHVLTINWPNSLGLFFATFTRFLGFVPYSDEWKVMGLAPYGRPGVDLNMFLDTHEFPYQVNTKLLIGTANDPYHGWPAALGQAREPEGEISDLHKDIAYAAQDLCEIAMMNVVRQALEKTKSRNLCLAGGVALNSKANGKILASGLIDNIFVQPASSDDGVALGAAMVPFLDDSQRLPLRPMRHAYLGASFEDDVIEDTLRIYKLRHSRLTDPAATAAELLTQGKILGWYQGRMEFGPRALGARSIIADPRDPEMNAKVNNAVKFREWWRPFAPSFKKEAAPEYLESAYDSPFMILTAQVRPEKRHIIPSVTHVDGSARPQTVEPEVNPLYYRLIDEFGKRTGVPVIMNTSFNLRGEAIVNSPTDAIRTFYSSGMDALILGSFLVSKNRTE
jgi:carbamoyltransferase